MAGHTTQQKPWFGPPSSAVRPSRSGPFIWDQAILSIREIHSSKDRKRFVDMVGQANKGLPAFVPPLVSQELNLIDTENHPFYEEGLAHFYFAEREGRPVGRIAAIRNPAFEKHWNESCGFFGFYDVLDRGQKGEEVSRFLMDRVREDLKNWKLTHFYGPTSPSSNYSLGALIQGFDLPPKVMMPYNPPSYGPFLEASGLEKAKDLLALDVDHGQPQDRLLKIAARIEKRHRVTIRNINLKDFKKETEILRDIFNGAWQYNWGFVPMTPNEFDAMAKELKALVDPELIFIAEIDDKPIGFCLCLPDINEALIHINGRLFPFGALKVLFHTMVWPKIRTARIPILGVLKEYENLGLGTLFYLRCFSNAKRKNIGSGEASWILEDNVRMVKALLSMGAKITKRYRVYKGKV